ncbi:peptidase S10 [Sphingomonas naphthae]|uniref:Peptidase S10 n=1 Tax=Sphingomonas naphthae TaxID=1813468 RepID=A0ABY7TMV5_9SPHN|nr:peptidase S10 [Sphingomonas naphthae]WCT74566.1 peptidase S10 [Sphingomonas naphthae]
MIRRFAAALMFTSLLTAAVPAAAQDKGAPKKEAPAPKKSDDSDLPPLPADRTVRQQAVIGGRSIAYDATVGTIPVRDAKGKIAGEVVFTAYTMPGAARGSRPVTFAFNGGPGASSVYLNLGAIGPKRVQFGAQGDSPSDSPVLTDNPASWLDFTDIVFIDPVGTGFSRSLVDEEQTKKLFYSAKPDIEYLSRVIYDWLLRNGRLTSPKYLAGESYGGYRVPRVAYHLQSQLGVGLNGLVLVSPYLDPTALRAQGTALSPLPYMATLPSMAAANLERKGQLSPAALQEVEDYTRGEYIVDLLRGRSDPAAVERLTTRVSAYTGLDPKIVRQLQGRVDLGTFLREIHRGEKKIGSVYDSNVTAYDPFPEKADSDSNDPILDALIAPTTSAMVDFVTTTVGWKVDARYNALSYDVNRMWVRDNSDTPVQDLRKAMAADPKMRVIVAHGMDDLSCPFFASRLIIDQLPVMGDPNRVKLSLYAGGHMFYSRPASGQAFREDIRGMMAR